MINQKPMCRRRFLGLSAGFASSALIPGIMKPPNLNADDSALSFPVANGYKTHVTSAWIGKGEHVNSSDLIERTLSAATDFKWLSKGDRVLIKLSINSGNVFPATSDPWMLNGLISILQKKGAGVIFVGDQSGVADVHWTTDSKKGSSRELCKSAELMRPIADNNAKPVFFEEAGYDGYFETRPENAHHWKTPIWLPNILKEVDHIIYAPRISSHIMGDITVGMKLGVGFLREDSRRDFHSGGSDFYAMYEEVNQFKLFFCFS